MGIFIQFLIVWYPIWIQGGSGSWERKIRIRIQGAEKIQIQIEGAEINRSGSRERGKTQIWIQGAEKHGSGSRERRNPRKLIQGAENTILNSGSEKQHEERKKSRIWIQSAKEKQA